MNNAFLHRNILIILKIVLLFLKRSILTLTIWADIFVIHPLNNNLNMLIVINSTIIIYRFSLIDTQS